MSVPLRVLVVEDVAGDAELIVRALRRGGFAPVYERVDTAEALRDALSRQRWHLVVSDFTMPRLTALEALRLVKELAPDVPFVVVSGTITEEMAVEAMRAGARDYVLKDKLARLVPAVERELGESALRAAHRESESAKASILDALRASEEQVRLLLDSTAEAIYGIDLEGLCTFANAACVRMLGYADKNDLLGKDMHELTHHTRRDGTPYPAEECRIYQAGLRDEGTSVDDEVLWRANRTGFPAEYRSFPIRRDERRVGTVVSFVDITRRKKSEDALHRSAEKLKNSEARFRALIEKSKEAIALANADGTIVYISPAGARISGLTPGEMVGMKAVEWVHPEDKEKFVGMMGAVLEDPSKSRTIEYRRHHRDGSTRWVESTATNLLADPAVGAIVGNFRDVTERKLAEEALRRTEEQLRHAQKMEAVGRLAGGVAHDFNNLLSVILTYSELVAAELPAGDPKRADVQEIRSAGKRASDLTRQLLAFSRQQVLQPKVVDLNEIVTGMEKLLRPLIGEDIDLTVLLSPLPAKVKVDPGQMEQVVMNLAVNSRDAMPRGGKLTIEISEVHLDETAAAQQPGLAAGPHVMLAVNDTGTGMDQATQARIFEPFFTTKEVGRGTGLGLSTVFGIVRQSGGTVSVESEPGKGATFRVYLPPVDPQTATESLTARASEPTVLRGSETILLVDDDEQVRKVARSILGRYGYRVLEAGGGGDALVVSEQHPSPVHLLVTDLVMPHMSGGALAARLRARHPDLKILFMSGYPDASTGQQGSRDPEIAILQKPITPEGLVSKVREVLDAPALQAATG